jgi:hypothetical protein
MTAVNYEKYSNSGEEDSRKLGHLNLRIVQADVH